MSIEQNKAVIHRLRDAINAGDFDTLDNILAPNYVRHDPNPLFADAGREQYKQAFRRVRGAFSDAHWTLDDLLAEGDKVVGRWTFRGTNDGPFFNIPPSGKVVIYPIYAIYRIANGKIAEDWHLFHSLTLWQTLIPEISELLETALK
jgi:predicted ester cyclase